MKMETQHGEIELNESEVALLRRANPEETRKGLVIDMDGKSHGEKKAASLRQRADGIFAGQIYFKGPNRKCEVEMGALENGDGVYFLRVHWSEEKNTATPSPSLRMEIAPRPVVIPKVKLPPVAPRRLETREDAEWYRAIFDEPHNLGKKAIWPQIWKYYGEKLGMKENFGAYVKGLSIASLAILAGDPDPWKDWKWKPLFPGDTDSPLFQNWEV